MSVIPWETYPEPWRTIGTEWSEILFAIANGGVPRPPTRLAIWDAAAFREQLRFRRLRYKQVARHLGVSEDMVSRWCSGRYAPSQGRQLAIRAMLDNFAAGVLTAPLPPR
jgi:hypothetical protein